MSKYRYVFTGGDNVYCGRCGGLGDRVLLRIDDENKTYKAYYNAPSCLGKYCWYRQDLYGGVTIVRGILIDGELYRDVLKPRNNKIYILEDGGNKQTYTKVTVKNNKYGKDGEFKDKLDTYKFEGFIESKEYIEQLKEKWENCE